MSINHSKLVIILSSLAALSTTMFVIAPWILLEGFLFTGLILLFIGGAFALGVAKFYIINRKFILNMEHVKLNVSNKEILLLTLMFIVGVFLIFIGDLWLFKDFNLLFAMPGLIGCSLIYFPAMRLTNFFETKY